MKNFTLTLCCLFASATLMAQECGLYTNAGIEKISALTNYEFSDLQYTFPVNKEYFNYDYIEVACYQVSNNKIEAEYTVGYNKAEFARIYGGQKTATFPIIEKEKMAAAGGNLSRVSMKYATSDKALKNAYIMIKILGYNTIGINYINNFVSDNGNLNGSKIWSDPYFLYESEEYVLLNRSKTTKFKKMCTRNIDLHNSASQQNSYAITAF